MAGQPAGLIACDVDGTLLTSAGRLSDRTRRALVAARDAGWHVVVATGRPVSIALPVVEELAVSEYLIAANGSTVAELGTGAVIFQMALAATLAREALRLARTAVPGLGAALLTTRGFVHEPGFVQVAPMTPAGGEVLDATPGPDDDVLNLVVFRAGVSTSELCAVLSAVLPDGMVASPSGLPGSAELTPPGVHKGSGLARLCAHLGIAQDRVVAFGDGINDLEMLAWAGTGVAMGNAEELVQARADVVTASNDDDGVAVVVERLVAAGGAGRPMAGAGQ